MVLFDEAPGPVASSGRSLGIVSAGFVDSPWRLKAGLGERTARGLSFWSSLAVQSLTRTAAELGVPIEATGTWHAALDQQEKEEWVESARLLRDWGIAETRVAHASELSELGLPGAIAGAVHVAGGGSLDVGAFMQALAARFFEAGGRCLSGHSVTLDERQGAPVALVGDQALECELAVVAAGASAPSVHPFFGSCVYPVRLQGQRLEAAQVTGARIPAAPVLARHRFEAWGRERDGGLGFVGSRWAEQPEMEAGVTEDTSVSGKVSEKQDAFLAERLGVSTEARRDRWTGIVAYTCDGLPILGPLPGAPKVIGLVGWSGWGLALMAQAVDEVTAAILGEDPPGGAGTPSWLVARRLI